jgi:hypothetical protein
MLQLCFVNVFWDSIHLMMVIQAETCSISQINRKIHLWSKVCSFISSLFGALLCHSTSLKRSAKKQVTSGESRNSILRIRHSVPNLINYDRTKWRDKSQTCHSFQVTVLSCLAENWHKYLNIVKPTWCTFYSVYYEVRTSTCFEHSLLIRRRRYTHGIWYSYIAYVLCQLAVLYQSWCSQLT